MQTPFVTNDCSARIKLKQVTRMVSLLLSLNRPYSSGFITRQQVVVQYSVKANTADFITHIQLPSFIEVLVGK